MRRRNAFTLVELLVVIGIIALLISILLPALNRARDQAKSVMCKSNMRQIYLALANYVNENKGRLPIPCNIGETFPQPYPNDAAPCAFFMMAAADQLDFDNGVLWPYLAPQNSNMRQAIVNCPSEVSDPIRPTSATSAGPRNFSYSFNDQLRGASVNIAGVTVYKGIKLTQIIHPGQKVLIVEEAWPNDTNADIETATPDPLGNHHNNGSNQCFADGHTDSYMPEDLGLVSGQSKVSDPVKQKFYCNLFAP